MACHQHTQQHHQNVLRDLFNCNYGLTTTQQQAHNRTSAGFQTIVVMVLQPHNSKFTIELLQDFKQEFQTQKQLKL